MKRILLVSFCLAWAALQAATLTVDQISDLTSGGIMVGQGQSNIEMLNLRLVGGVTDINLSSLKVDETGTIAADSEINAVKAFNNPDGSATFNGDESFLASASFSGQTTTLTFAPFVVPASTTQYLLLSVDVAGNATVNSTIQLTIVNSGYFTVGGGDSVSCTACPGSNTAVTVRPSITVSSTDLAPTLTFRGNTNEELLSVNLVASAGTGTFTSLTVQATGTSSAPDTDTTAVKLYKDVNGDGIIGGGDTLVKSGTFAGGTVSFSGFSETVTTTTTKFIVAVDVSNTATLDNLIGVLVQDETAVGFSDAFVNTFTTISSSDATIKRQEITVSGTDLAPTKVFRGEKSVSILQLNFSVNVGAATISSVKVTKSGTAADADVANVYLYRDMNSDGVADQSDLLLGQTTFVGGSANFGALAEAFDDSNPMKFIVVVDVAAGATFSTTIGASVPSSADITTSTATATVLFSGSIASSNTPTLKKARIAGVDLAPVNAARNTQDILMLRVDLQTVDAGGGSLTFDALTLTKTGTISDANISNIELWKDDGDQAFSATLDTQLSIDPVTFSGGSVTFSGLSLSVAEGATQSLFFRIDLGSGAFPGDTFGLKLSSGSDVTLVESDAFVADFSTTIDPPSKGIADSDLNLHNAGAVQIGDELVLSSGTANEERRSDITAINNAPNSVPLNLTFSAVFGQSHNSGETVGVGLPLRSTVTEVATSITATPTDKMPTNVRVGGTGTIGLRVKFESDGGTGIINSIKVTKKGTALDTDVALVALYKDVNNNQSQYDDVDVLLATGAFSGGTATLSGFELTVDDLNFGFALLTVDIDPNATVGNTIGIEVTDPANDVGFKTASTMMNSTNFPLTSSNATIAPYLMVRLMKGAMPPSGISPGQTDVTMLHLQLSAYGTGGVSVNGVTVTKTGSGSPSLVAAKVFWDADCNAVADGAALVTESQPYSSPVSLSFPNQNIPNGLVQCMLIAYDVDTGAVPTTSFGAQVAAASDVSVAGNADVLNTLDTALYAQANAGSTITIKISTNNGMRDDVSPPSQPHPPFVSSSPEDHDMVQLSVGKDLGLGDNKCDLNDGNPPLPDGECKFIWDVVAASDVISLCDTVECTSGVAVQATHPVYRRVRLLYNDGTGVFHEKFFPVNSDLSTVGTTITVTSASIAPATAEQGESNVEMLQLHYRIYSDGNTQISGMYDPGIGDNFFCVALGTESKFQSGSQVIVGPDTANEETMVVDTADQPTSGSCNGAGRITFVGTFSFNHNVFETVREFASAGTGYIDQIRVGHGGTGAQTDATEVAVWRDENGNGTIDGGDPKLGTMDFGSYLNVPAIYQEIPSLTTTHWIIALSFKDGAKVGDTHSVSITNANDFNTPTGTGLSLSLPYNSAAATIGGNTLTVSGNSSAPTFVKQGDSNIQMLNLNFSVDLGTAEVNSTMLTFVGTTRADVAQAIYALDVNQDTRYSPGNNFVHLTDPATATLDFICVENGAGFNVGDAVYVGIDTQNVDLATVGAAPAVDNVKCPNAPSLRVDLKPINTGDEPDALDYNHSTGEEVSVGPIVNGVNSVDVLLGNGAFGGVDTVTFAGTPFTVRAGVPRTALILFDIAGGATVNDTVSVRVSAAGDVGLLEAGDTVSSVTFPVASQSATVTDKNILSLTSSNLAPAHFQGAAGSTTLSAAASQGATQIQVSSASGFKQGDTIIIDSGGANEEFAYVGSVDTGLNTLTISALAKSHNPGEAVQNTDSSGNILQMMQILQLDTRSSPVDISQIKVTGTCTDQNDQNCTLSTDVASLRICDDQDLSNTVNGTEPCYTVTPVAGAATFDFTVANPITGGVAYRVGNNADLTAAGQQNAVDANCKSAPPYCRHLIVSFLVRSTATTGDKLTSRIVQSADITVDGASQVEPFSFCGNPPAECPQSSGVMAIGGNSLTISGISVINPDQQLLQGDSVAVLRLSFQAGSTPDAVTIQKLKVRYKKKYSDPNGIADASDDVGAVEFYWDGGDGVFDVTDTLISSTTFALSTDVAVIDFSSVASSDKTFDGDPVSQTTDHRTGFIVYKISSTTQAVATSLTAQSNSGTDTLTVADASFFSVNDRILVDYGGTTQELHEIKGIAGNTLTLFSNLSFTHSTGAVLIPLERVGAEIPDRTFLEVNSPNTSSISGGSILSSFAYVVGNSVAISGSIEAPAKTTPGSQEAIEKLTFTLSPPVGSVTVTGVKVMRGGVGSTDSDVSAVQLYLDNGDGSFSASLDTLVGSGTFSAGAVNITLTSPFTVTSSASKDLFIVYQISSTAVKGVTLTAEVQSAADITLNDSSDVVLTANFPFSSDDISTTLTQNASPGNSSLFVNSTTGFLVGHKIKVGLGTANEEQQSIDSLGTGKLNLTSTLNNSHNINDTVKITGMLVRNVLTVSGVDVAPSTLSTGQQDVALLKLTLAASSQTMTVNQIKAVKTGTALDSDISLIKLFLDDGSGTLDGSDTQIATTTFSSGVATFSSLSESIVSGTPKTYFLAIDVASGATVNNTVGLQLSDNTFLSVVSPDEISSSNFPIASSNSTIQSFDTLTVSLSDKAPSSAKPGDTVTMAQLTLTAGSGQVTVTDLKIDETGTSTTDTDVAFVRLYEDINTNGTYEDGTDVALATGSFASQTLTLSGLNFTVDYTTPRYLLIRYDISNSSNLGVTARVTLNSATYITVVAPDAVSTTGYPKSSNHTTISQQDTLTVSGTDLAPANVNQGDSKVVFDKLTLTLGSGTATVNTVKVKKTGTASDSGIDKVYLYQDLTNDCAASGCIDAGDALLASSTFSGGSVTFSGLTLTLDSSTPKYLLIAYDISAGAVAGKTVGAELTNNTYIVLASPDVVSTSNFPISSSLSNIKDSADIVTVTSTNVASSQVAQTTTKNPFLKIAFSVASGAAQVTKIKVDKTGTATDTDISEAHLFKDTNGNGAIDSGEPELATSSFSGGTLTFDFSTQPLQITASSSPNALVALDIAGSATLNATIGVSLIDSTYVTLSTTVDSVANTGFPHSSSASTIVPPPNELTVSGTDLAPATIDQGDSNVVLLGIGLSAGSGTITVTSVKVDKAGTLADSSIADVALYQDVNGNNTLEIGTDTALGNGTLASGSISFTGLSVSVATGTPVTLLGVVSVSASANSGDTVGLKLVDNTYVSVASPDTVLSTNFPISSSTPSISGNTLTASATSFAPATASTGTGNLVMLQVKLSADKGDVTATGVTVTKTGTSTKDSDVTTVKVYHDTNGNGLQEGGEPLLSSGSFSSGSATLAFSSTLTVTAGTDQYLLILYDIATLADNNVTVGVKLADNSAITVSAPDAVAATNFPLSSSDTTIQDTVAPSAISNLGAAPGTATGEVTLTWTATGDDGVVGTATSYTIKYNTSVITGANWAASTTVASPPTPQVAGTAETFIVTGLTPLTQYYFAIEAVDDAGNSGSLSNSPFATAPDKTPPTLSSFDVAGTSVSTDSEMPLVLIGQNVSVSIQATDNVAVQEVNAYVKKASDTSYTKVSLTKSSGNTYTGSVSASFVTPDNVSIYVEALDTSSNSATFPTGGSSAPLTMPTFFGDAEPIPTSSKDLQVVSFHYVLGRTPTGSVTQDSATTLTFNKTVSGKSVERYSSAYTIQSSTASTAKVTVNSYTVKTLATAKLRAGSPYVFFDGKFSMTAPQDIETAVMAGAVKGQMAGKFKLKGKAKEELEVRSDVVHVAPWNGTFEKAFTFDFQVSEADNKVALYRYDYAKERYRFVNGIKQVTARGKGEKVKVQSSTKALGSFALFADYQAPRVKTDLQPGQEFYTKKPKLEFQIEDYGAGVGKEQIQFVLDGKEIKDFEYDEEKGTFVWTSPVKLPGGEHTLTFSVEDRVKNRAKPLRFTIVTPGPLQIQRFFSFPNPSSRLVRAQTELKLKTPYDAASVIKIQMYSVAGREIGVICEGSLFGCGREEEKGRFRFSFRGQNGISSLPNGVYFLRVVVDDDDSKATKIFKTVILR